MKLEELLQACGEETGCGPEMADRIVTCFLNRLVEELAMGQTVDLGREFGVFSVKLRTAHLAENSPRTPKDSHYKVVFREGNGMAKKLKVSASGRNGQSQKGGR